MACATRRTGVCRWRVVSFPIRLTARIDIYLYIRIYICIFIYSLARPAELGLDSFPIDELSAGCEKRSDSSRYGHMAWTILGSQHLAEAHYMASCSFSFRSQLEIPAQPGRDSTGRRRLTGSGGPARVVCVCVCVCVCPDQQESRPKTARGRAAAQRRLGCDSDAGGGPPASESLRHPSLMRRLASASCDRIDSRRDGSDSRHARTRARKDAEATRVAPRLGYGYGRRGSDARLFESLRPGTRERGLGVRWLGSLTGRCPLVSTDYQSLSVITNH